MVNTCHDYNKKFTIYMEVDDWRNMEMFYTVWNDEGRVSKDSFLRECHRHEHDDEIIGCTFELGYISDYATVGLEYPIQMRAAWMNAPGDLGMLWYEHEWIKHDN